MADNKQYLNINKIIGDWLERLLWLWLPFYGIIRLTKDVIAKHNKDKK